MHTKKWLLRSAGGMSPRPGGGGVARPPWHSDGDPASVPTLGSACEPDMWRSFPEGHAGPGGSVPSAKANSQRHCPTGKMLHLSGGPEFQRCTDDPGTQTDAAAMIPLLPSTGRTSLLHRQVPRGPAEWRLLGSAHHLETANPNSTTTASARPLTKTKRNKVPCIPILEPSKACLKLTSEGKRYPLSLLLGCKEVGKDTRAPSNLRPTVLVDP